MKAFHQYKCQCELQWSGKFPKASGISIHRFNASPDQDITTSLTESSLTSQVEQNIFKHLKWSKTSVHLITSA